MRPYAASVSRSFGKAALSLAMLSGPLSLVAAPCGINRVLVCVEADSSHCSHVDLSLVAHFWRRQPANGIRFTS